MKEVEFTLPIKVNGELSLNKIYRGIHWSERRKQANQIHEIIRLTLLSNKIPGKYFEKPVKTKFWWNSILDLDNHAYVTKLIIDGLKGYLIHDDSKKYVQEINHAYWLGNGVKVKISETEESIDYGNKK